MEIEGRKVKVFKMKNRKGYAAICDNCLTEGATSREAVERMVKAVRRTRKNPKES